MSDAPAPDDLVRVQVARLGLDATSNSFVVVLREAEGARFLPIWIGRTEAEAIAAHLQGVARERPMTHDLLRGLLATLEVTLERVAVTHVVSGTFFAELRLVQGDARRTQDSRPSDAIALAVRCDAPVFVSAALLLEPSDDPEDDAPFLGDLPEEDPLPGPAAPASPAEALQRYLSSLRPEDFGKFRP